MRRSPDAAVGALVRVLGVGFGIAVIIGNTVGAGILRTPGVIAARLPSPALIVMVWLAGGAYAILAANALAELGTMLPRAGAQYVYVRHALGPYAGFVVGWTDWAAQCGGVAALALVVGGSFVALIPPLASHTVSVALVIVALLTLLLWRSVRWSDRVQGITSALKALAFIALLVACFAGPVAAVGSASPVAMPRGFALGVALIIAFQGVIFAYNGWAGILYFAEEVRDPGRSIPRALFGALVLVIALYLLVNLGFLRVLSLPGLARSPLPAAAAAHVLFGARGDRVVHGLVAITLVSAVTANLLMASRVSYALARDGFLARAGARVNAGGTPAVALGASAAAGSVFLMTGTFEAVIAILSIFFVLAYTLSITSLFILRGREPTTPRPWRAIGHPWTTGLVLVGSVVFLISAIIGDPHHSAAAAIVVAASYPLYRLRDRTGTWNELSA